MLLLFMLNNALTKRLAAAAMILVLLVAGEAARPVRTFKTETTIGVSK